MAIKRKGIDISYCQKGFNLENAKKEGVEFAIIRAGIGIKEKKGDKTSKLKTYKDTEFKKHTQNAEKIDLPYGYYWYSGAFSVTEAKTEAKACLNIIKTYNPSYPVFYDMEEGEQIDNLTTKERTDIIVAFCEEIKKAGYIAGVYLNPSWLENYVDKSKIVGKYDIWLAHWTENPNIPSKYNYGQVMWQWGLDKINGCGVDGDICFKDYPIKSKKPVDNGNKENDTKVDLHKGDEVKLNNAALYAAATSTVKANTVSGNYFIHSDGVINGRVRITTTKGNPVCTGWVSESDCNKVTGTTEPENPVIPAPATSDNVTALKKGDEITLNKAALYGSAASTTKANTLAGKYFIYTDGVINNRVRITTSKGNSACTGWVNVSDCNTVNSDVKTTTPSAPVKNANTFKKGDSVKLTNASLYAASTSTVKANTLTGTYYVHSEGVINNRIRITTSKGNSVCTGWVNVADCK